MNLFIQHLFIYIFEKSICCNLFLVRQFVQSILKMNIELKANYNELLKKKKVYGDSNCGEISMFI